MGRLPDPCADLLLVVSQHEDGHRSTEFQPITFIELAPGPQANHAQHCLVRAGLAKQCRQLVLGGRMILSLLFVVLQKNLVVLR